MDVSAAASFVDHLDACTGRVLITGIGKSGCVGRRMSCAARLQRGEKRCSVFLIAVAASRVSLMSTGTLAHFVHVTPLPNLPPLFRTPAQSRRSAAAERGSMPRRRLSGCTATSAA